MTIGTADLTGVRAKLRRAEEHLHALKSEFDVWLEINPDIGLFHIRRDDPWYIVTCDPVPEPNLRFALIVGDLIHNLRSALDHLVWQLVLRDGQEPSYINQFPIFDDRDKFLQEVKFRKKNPERSILYGITTDGDAWTIIETAQPYNCTPVYASDLRCIARLSNRDKHRTLYTYEPIVTDNINEVISWNPDAILLEMRTSANSLSFKEPTEVIRYRFADHPNPSVHVNGKLAIFPCFGEPPIEVGAVQVSIGHFPSLIIQVSQIVDQVSRLPRVTENR